MAGDVIGAYGAREDGKAGKAAGEYNAKVAEQNATYSRQQAAEDERRQRVFAKKFIGDQRASYAASGITMDASALDVIQESAATAELDALTIRNEGEQKYRAYRNEASSQIAAGQNADRAGTIRAAAYIGNGASKSASKGKG